MTRCAGAAPAARMLEVDIEIHCHVENRARLAMIGVGKLVRLEFHRFVFRQKRNLRHALIVPIQCVSLISTGHTGRLMFQEIEDKLSAAVAQQLASKFNVTIKVSLEQPKLGSFGELAIPVAFQLARQLRRSPKQIAEELVRDFPRIEGVAGVEIAGNGYINVRLDRAAYVLSLLAPTKARETQPVDKIIVEHTNINPNKAAHIGHVRNAILGDTLAR